MDADRRHQGGQGARRDGRAARRRARGCSARRSGAWTSSTSENSMGFHAPQEAARILGEAIDYAQPGADCIT